MEVVPVRRSALLILSLRESYLHQNPAGVAVRPSGGWGRLRAKPANGVTTDPDGGTPAGRAVGDSGTSNPANEVTTDPEAENRVLDGLTIPAPPRSSSSAEPYREIIEPALMRGRNAMAIWQDLISDHGFGGSYEAVKRFVRKLGDRVLEILMSNVSTRNYERDRPRLRPFEPGPTEPESQDPKRRGEASRRSGQPGAFGDAGGIPTPLQGRHRQTPHSGRVAEAASSRRCSSLDKGLEELFTISRLDLSPAMRLCLGTTNVIDSSHSGIRTRTRRVSRWKDGQMVLRWAASAFLATEKGFRRIQGYH